MNNQTDLPLRVGTYLISLSGELYQIVAQRDSTNYVARTVYPEGAGLRVSLSGIWMTGPNAAFRSPVFTLLVQV